MGASVNAGVDSKFAEQALFHLRTAQCGFGGLSRVYLQCLGEAQSNQIQTRTRTTSILLEDKLSSNGRVKAGAFRGTCMWVKCRLSDA